MPPSSIPILVQTSTTDTVTVQKPFKLAVSNCLFVTDHFITQRDGGSTESHSKQILQVYLPHSTAFEFLPVSFGGVLFAA